MIGNYPFKGSSAIVIPVVVCTLITMNSWRIRCYIKYTRREQVCMRFHRGGSPAVGQDEALVLFGTWDTGSPELTAEIVRFLRPLTLELPEGTGVRVKSKLPC